MPERSIILVKTKTNVKAHEGFPPTFFFLFCSTEAVASCKKEAWRRKSPTHSSSAFCSFSPSLQYLSLIMSCLSLSLSVSSAVSLAHQFPSFIRQQSLVFPSKRFRATTATTEANHMEEYTYITLYIFNI